MSARNAPIMSFVPRRPTLFGTFRRRTTSAERQRRRNVWKGRVIHLVLRTIGRGR